MFLLIKKKCINNILRNVLRNAKCKLVILIFTQFSNFYDADHLLYYPQMSVFSFHTFVVLLY